MITKLNDSQGGLAGNILWLDLTRNKVWSEPTEEYVQRWIGGRAVASWILLNHCCGMKWHDPDNLLIFSPGCLVGTAAPGASRTSVDSINVFGNYKGSANFGGHWGPELKYAGYDHIVIRGKSPVPVYLYIKDSSVDIRDASHLWGKCTDETEEILHKETQDKRTEVISIGPAGENRVRGSAIFGDCGQAAGGSGVGCVMGDKKLKAIAVRGHGAIGVARPFEFEDATERMLEKIEASPLIKGEGGFESFRHGIVLSYRYGEKPSTGAVVRNGQDEFTPLHKMAQLVGKEKGVPKFYKRMWACYGCPIGCQPFLEVGEGKYKGTKGFSYWANSKGYSIRMDSYDPATSAKFQNMVNKLGLDGDSTVVATAWAFECYEKGLFTDKDTDGLRLLWGNDDAWLELTEKIAFRQGWLGNLLADGVYEAAKRLGRGSESLVTHCKKQAVYESIRSMPGWCLGIATSPVGGHHLRGAVSTPATSGPRLEVLPRNAHSPENQPEAVYWQLRTKEIEDMAGTCVFMGSLSGAHALEPSDYLELINSALGVDLNEEELMDIAEAGYNLEKAFNTLNAGLTRKDDYPPERYMEEPIQSGPMAGQKIDRQVFDRMLDRFYELLGWDKTTGLQTRRNLRRLGLDDVARKLEQAGKLIE